MTFVDVVLLKIASGFGLAALIGAIAAHSRLDALEAQLRKDRKP